MLPYLTDRFGNASSPYCSGREARKAVDNARDRIAALTGADSREIVMTSGGTEGLILGIIGGAVGNRHRGNHIITSAFEHHAVEAIFDFLCREMGFESDMVGIDSDGIVRPDELENLLRDDTVLVSVMAVNNEIGTIQPIGKIVEMCSSREILVHSDCVQAVGKMPLDFNDLGVDIATTSGHKYGGPKGTGFIYIRAGTHIKPICEGSQEFGIRSGTENIPGIVGMSAALEEAVNEREGLEKKLLDYRSQIIDCILSTAPDAKINGNPDKCVTAILNMLLPGIEGEMLVLGLDREGVETSTGSACHSGSTEPSHVLSALGLSKIDAQSSLRISMGHSTTQDDVDKFKSVFPKVYNRVKASAVH